MQELCQHTDEDCGQTVHLTPCRPSTANFSIGKVFAKYDKNTTMADLYGDRVTEIEKEIRENPTFGTTPQREQILNASTEQLRDYRIEEAYQLRKSRMFWCCFISNFFGLTLTFYSLSLTVIFEKFDPDQTLFIVSFIFYVPAVVWFIYVYLPCKNGKRTTKENARADSNTQALATCSRQLFLRTRRFR